MMSSERALRSDFEQRLVAQRAGRERGSRRLQPQDAVGRQRQGTRGRPLRRRARLSRARIASRRAIMYQAGSYAKPHPASSGSRVRKLWPPRLMPVAAAASPARAAARHPQTADAPSADGAGATPAAGPRRTARIARTARPAAARSSRGRSMDRPSPSIPPFHNLRRDSQMPIRNEAKMSAAAFSSMSRPCGSST